MCSGASRVAQMEKNLPEIQETRVPSQGREDPLEEEMATPLQYSCLENPMGRGAWRATYSPGGRKELDRTQRLTLSLHLGEERGRVEHRFF